MTKQPIYEYSTPFIPAIVIRRPSKTNKSPYVADIELQNDSGDTTHVLAHSPSLDANGLVSQGKRVLCQPSNNTTRKTQYTIECAIDENGTIIGLKPLIANRLLICLSNKQTQLDIPKVSPEMQKNSSRFDFASYSQNTYIEIKGVPLADNGVAFFPHGYRKTRNEPISRRAVKHLQELTKLAKEGNKTYLIFITQRPDVHTMIPSNRDSFFKEAFKKAIQAGVIVKCFSFQWYMNGKCFFIGEIPIFKK